jgi:hypothetical protein
MQRCLMLAAQERIPGTGSTTLELAYSVLFCKALGDSLQACMSCTVMTIKIPQQ